MEIKFSFKGCTSSKMFEKPSSRQLFQIDFSMLI